MSGNLTTLALLSAELQLPLSLDELLQRVLVRVGQLTATPRATIRLFDAQRIHLFIGARLGQPVHDVQYEMQPGEGLLGWVAKQGKPLRSGDAERDPRFLPRPGQREPLGSFLGVPLIYQGSTIGVLVAVHAEKDHFSEDHELVLRVVGGLCSPHLEVARLARLARIDPVTGALRPDALDAVFPEVGGTGEVSQLSVLVADVDAFTLINQRLGRDTGDVVLRDIARTLAGVLRVGDAVIRFAADAFLLVLPGVGLASASRIGERVRQVVAERLAERLEPPLQGTISVGAAELGAGESREKLIGRALLALDEARRRGGNTVHMAIA